MSHEPLDVRDATVADLPALKAIYDVQVLGSVSTFELVPPPLDFWTERLRSLGDGVHLLVAVEAGGEVLGYAASAPYRPRPAYGRTRETSIHVAESARGHGVARSLYDDLLDRLDADGVHTVLAVIALPNPASEALHRACGFERVGVLPEVGHKLGRWVDTALWARVHR